MLYRIVIVTPILAQIPHCAPHVVVSYVYVGYMHEALSVLKEEPDRASFAI
jgi:hypothetical protein